MATAINQKMFNERLVRATTFCLLALAALLCHARQAQAQWVTNGTTTTTTGNVGIGTTTPSQMFHVHSIGTWAGTRITTAATGSTINDGVHFGYDDQYGAYIWNREATSLVFSTSNTERARLDAAGNLGIGTTTPASRLHVGGGNILLDNSFHLAAKDPSGTVRDVLYGRWVNDTTILRGGTGGLIFDVNNTNTNSLIIDGSGRIGMNHGTHPQVQQWLGTSGNVFGQIISLSPGHTYPAIEVRNSAETPIADITASGGAYFAGNVGLGTNAPVHKLDVSGNMTIGSGYTSSVSVPVNGLVVQGGVGIGTSAPDAQYKLDVAGDVRVSGNIAAKYQDVAEWVPSAQKLNAGTVVILDIGRDNHVAASFTPYDTRVAGVVSAQPGISLGERGEDKVLVATTGRVKVKVDATRGAIHVGDLLVTSEREGYAMKSEPVMMGNRPFHSPGTIVGKALGSLEKGTGEILVLLSLQ
ncbi:MAG TPA: hypothetical protein VM934_11775 [Pyrinomonadaceae bacterium]|jgi:hypothetical protein|nr:hypothetical protein [Pyrinomonadaceae bacterium]